MAEDLIEGARSGDARSLARLLSSVEDDPANAPHVTSPGTARVIGLTGAPGVGKSTLTTALIGHFRKADLRVAVLAIDPTSPFSGGALLGDRIRMQEFALDSAVFIRSMATRGHLGGLAAAVPHAVRVLDSSGFDVILIETVGVGQSEVDIAAHADTTVVLLAPGMGDGIQAAKAGLLEIGDIYVVNKADREGADTTAREIQHAISLGPARGPDDWRQRVLLTSADRNVGIEDLARALADHREWLEAHGQLQQRRRARAVIEVEQIAFGMMRNRLAQRLVAQADRVESGEIDPYRAAAEIVDTAGLG